MYHISHTLALIHNPNISFSCLSTQYEIVSYPFQMLSDVPAPTVSTNGATASIMAALTSDAEASHDEASHEEASRDDDSSGEPTDSKGSDTSSSSAKSTSLGEATTSGPESEDGGEPTGVPKSKPAPKGARASKEVPKGTPSNGTRKRIPKFPRTDPIQNNDVLLAAYQAPAASGGQREAPAASGGQLGQPRGQQRGKPFSILSKEIANGVKISFPARAYDKETSFPMEAHAEKQRWVVVKKGKTSSNITQYWLVPWYPDKNNKTFDTRHPGILCDVFNTCARNLVGDCHFGSSCHKLHFEPGDVVSHLPGNPNCAKVGVCSVRYSGMPRLARILNTKHATFQQRIRTAREELRATDNQVAARESTMKALRELKTARNSGIVTAVPPLLTSNSARGPPMLEALPSVEEVQQASVLSPPGRSRGVKREREQVPASLPFQIDSADEDASESDAIPMSSPPRLPIPEDLALWSGRDIDDFSEAIDRTASYLKDERQYRSNRRKAGTRKRARIARRSRQRHAEQRHVEHPKADVPRK